MEAVVLTNDYLPRPGVDIFPICKSLKNTKKVHRSSGTISPPVHRPWPGVTRRRQWVSALLIPLIDGRVTINY